MPPRLYCPECGSDDHRNVSLSGRGTIRTWTTIHVGPTRYEHEVPYTVVMVDLEEGARLMGRLAASEQAKIGANVDLSHVDEDRGPVFRIAGNGAS
jgi:hypothetical protein